MDLTEADRAARILAVDRMQTIGDTLRTMKNAKGSFATQNKIQKLEAERKSLRETYMKLAWSNPAFEDGSLQH